MKHKSQVRLADISDVHTFNRKTPTELICDNMQDVIFGKQIDFKSLDILFFSGDFFDRGVDYNHYETPIVEAFMVRILMACKEHDVIVRALEGTPSHDRKQYIHFEKINKLYNINADFKWVQELSIEYIEKINKTVLYVPDEWGEGPDETLKEVRKMVKSLPGGKVDIAIMHGNFAHQLPAHLKFQMHDREAYEELVRSVIIIGHVHLHSMLGKVIAPGSFDRISQGEEGPKGMVVVDIKEDHSFEAKFIENKNAKIYKKVDCSGLSLEETYTKIDDIAKTLPAGSELLIACTKDDAILQSDDIYPVRFPDINWRIEAQVEKKKIDKEAFRKESLMKVGNELTADNIKQILFGRITGKIKDPEIIQSCKNILEEMG